MLTHDDFMSIFFSDAVKQLRFARLYRPTPRLLRKCKMRTIQVRRKQARRKIEKQYTKLAASLLFAKAEDQEINLSDYISRKIGN